jgi:hypothetical protein
MRTFQKNHARAYGFTLITRKGSAAPHAKLNEDAVRLIRSKKLTRSRLKGLMKKYKCAETTIRAAYRGLNWECVPK